MTGSDLTLPLGMEEKKPVKRLSRIPFRLVGGIVAGALFVGLCTWLALVNDPLGGEPMAVALIEPEKPAAPVVQSAAEPTQPAADAPKQTPAVAAAPDGAAAPAATLPSGGQIDNEAGVIVVRGFPPPQSGPAVIKAPDAGATETKLAAVEPDLVERSKQGMIPKVSAQGERPSTVYARPVTVPASFKTATPPRIAILVGGMGISQNGTAEAIAKLPASVTLAFAPYGNDLERVVQRARSGGHEVMLQAPMEPFDYPDNDPGPQTLLTANTPEQNLERLHWQMSRFGGYIGITNYMGAKFTSTEEALTPVLKEIASRGLIYADDGSSPRSMVDQLARPIALATSKADIVVDATPTASGIDGALAKLEQMARDKGSAFGVATGMPMTVARITEWSRHLEQRGILLVPVSALAKP